MKNLLNTEESIFLDVRRATLLVCAALIEAEADFIEKRCDCPNQASVFRLIVQILRKDAEQICEEKENAEDAKSSGHVGG
jgi:hypothetical protein